MANENQELAYLENVLLGFGIDVASEDHVDGVHDNPSVRLGCWLDEQPWTSVVQDGARRGARVTYFARRSWPAVVTPRQ